MKSNCVILIVSTLLILLFTYTAVSKLLEFDTFKGQMLNQPLPKFLSSQLVWAVPLAELVTAGLLVIKPFRLIGLCCALLLMTGFTLYVALVLFHVFERVPCSCGGIMESLSWEGHLIVNALFWLMALIGVALEIKKSGTFKPAS
jgi:putative oxidoreductase